MLGFEVRKKLKRFRLLIFALSILMSFCFAYPKYDSLGGIHFLSLNLALANFENMDQEDLALDPSDESKGIISASFIDPSHLGIHLFQDFVPFPFQAFFFVQKTSILRC